MSQSLPRPQTQYECAAQRSKNQFGSIFSALHENGTKIEHYMAAGIKLRNHLHSRHPPSEKHVRQARIKQMKEHFAEQCK